MKQAADLRGCAIIAVDPDTGRIRANRNQTVLGALPKDVQTIFRELARPVRAFSALIEGQKRAFSLLYPISSLYDCFGPDLYIEAHERDRNDDN